MFTEYKELIPHLKKIKESLSLDSPRILYPCSGKDITPIRVWSKANITFVDLFEKYIAMLKGLSLDARCDDVETMDFFETFNLMYIHNCIAKLDNCLDALVKDSYVICNYNSVLFECFMKQCKFIGATQSIKKGLFFKREGVVFDLSRDFFSIISSFEDYEKSAPSKLRYTVQSIAHEYGITEQEEFEFLRTEKERKFYKKYGELYVFQK